MTIIMNLITSNHSPMSTLDFTPKKPIFPQFDTKSQVSTQGDETSDYTSLQNFCLLSRTSDYHRIHKSKLKSSLCRNFTQKGVCPYGSKCQFAHGTHELRINEDATNNSYKTKPCNAFFKKGHCHYGYRCNFVHREGQNMQKKDWKLMKQNHKEVFENLKEKNQSRLMRILDLEE